MSAAAEEREVASDGGVVNVAALLAPLAGENPAGASLQYDGMHDDIREARRADDQFSQGEWQRERKLADWTRVIELASEALATKSKDLQVGAWLAEALVHLHGFVGLRDGLKVMRGLQLNFWDGLFPEPDEGDLEARANSLAWLDRQLSLAIKGVALTEGAGGIRYTYSDWEDSQNFDVPERLDELESADLERINGVRMQAADEGKITSEQWRAAKNTTARPFYETAFAVLNDCWAELQALDAVTDEKFERQAPGLHSLSRTLEDVRALMDKIVREKRELEPDSVAEESSESAADKGQGAGASASSSRSASRATVASREEAYRKLSEAAAYFREAEPHSPVSYLVERAIKWGQMPLEEWLAEVVKSEDVLLNLRETLGIKRLLNGEQGDADEGGDS
jgi:type VI secretion system protein ImpA